jgi:trk system potassium uptake protein
MIRQRKKQNHVVIAGCGNFGADMAMKLSMKGVHVSIIDSRVEAFRGIPRQRKIEMFIADATEINVLKLCGIAQADMLIAATDDDYTNIKIAEIADEIFKVPKAVARIYDFKSMSPLVEQLNILPVYPNVV